MITEKQAGDYRPELFEIINEIEKTKDIVGTLKHYGGKYSSFTDYLRCGFDKQIQFLLPDGKPPYNPSNPSSVPSTWHKRHMDLRYFVEVGGGSNDMSQVKRESMFIQLLESIHPEDAVIVCKMVEKKTTTKKLTKKAVMEALPDLIKES